LEAQQELWMGWGWVMGMEMGGEGESIWSSLIFFGDVVTPGIYVGHYDVLRLRFKLLPFFEFQTWEPPKSVGFYTI
jgi:hypothetical protein